MSESGLGFDVEVVQNLSGGAEIYLLSDMGESRTVGLLYWDADSGTLTAQTAVCTASKTVPASTPTASTHVTPTPTAPTHVTPTPTAPTRVTPTPTAPTHVTPTPTAPTVRFMNEQEVADLVQYAFNGGGAVWNHLPNEMNEQEVAALVQNAFMNKEHAAPTTPTQAAPTLTESTQNTPTS